MDGPYLTAKLGASLVSLCAREAQPPKPKYPKRECTHEKPAFANGKLRGKCFDCYPKSERKQFTWVKTAARACKFCGSEFTALGPNLYCSPQCKTLQTKRMQKVRGEARWESRSARVDCAQCKNPIVEEKRRRGQRRKFCSTQCRSRFDNLKHGPERARREKSARHQLAADDGRLIRRPKGMVARRCLWCLCCFDVAQADLDNKSRSGVFCSRECSFSDSKLHGGNQGLRRAWNDFAAQFEKAQMAATLFAMCADCQTPIHAAAMRCAECKKRANKKAAILKYRQKTSVIRECPCCQLAWSAIDRAGPRRHCYTEECNKAFELHQRAARQAERRKRGGQGHQSRARRYGCARESFDPLEVLARDRWRCQLCGVKTPKAKRGSIDDDAPELDHVVPLSKGGPHTRANTQCLCRRCNQSKSDTARGQLGLTF